MIKVITCKDYEEVSDKAAEIMLEVVKSNPQCTLGLATGSSPIGLYKRMIKDHQENGTSYSEVKTYNLDEYVGLPITHPESYYSFMHRNLFDHIDVKEENVHIPSSQGDDLQANCDAYNAALAQAQIDIQVLGIGSDGHIGFNEPGTPFDSVTHITYLKESTIKDNARFFDDDINKVPTQAITMGISNVMAAKKVILLATGTNKAKAVAEAIQGEQNVENAATALQDHPDVYFILDEAAASLLKPQGVEIVNTEKFDSVIANGSVIVDFYADWCGPCKMIAPMLDELAKAYENVRFVKVNVDHDPDVAARFEVTSIPNLCCFKDGQLVNRAVGYQTKDGLIRLIESTM